MKQKVTLTEADIHRMIDEAVDEYCFSILNEVTENPEQLNEMAPAIAAAVRTLARPAGKWIGKAVGKGFTKGVAKAGTTQLGKTIGKNLTKRDLAKLRRLVMNGAEIFATNKILDKTLDNGNGTNRTSNPKTGGRRGTRRSDIRF